MPVLGNAIPDSRVRGNYGRGRRRFCPPLLNLLQEGRGEYPSIFPFCGRDLQCSRFCVMLYWMQPAGGVNRVNKIGGPFRVVRREE